MAFSSYVMFKDIFVFYEREELPGHEDKVSVTMVV